MNSIKDGAWPPTSRRTFLAAATLIGASGLVPGSAAKSAVSATPELTVGERPWLEAYLAAFNRMDFPGFGAFYSDDVQFFGQAATLNGREAVLDFYRMVRSYADEKVELLTFVGSLTRNRILAELRTTLVARRNWPDMPTGAMAAGEQRQSVNFVMYDIAAGRFTRVRSARFSPQREARS